MASERRSIRGTILVEDKRQERFVRALLCHLGFEIRRFTFEVAPAGRGAAEAWVRRQYPAEVKVLRGKSYQKSLCLVAMRDGDASGVSTRKRELDDELAAEGHAKRGVEERISTPVPTWSIETWLLRLLGEDGLTEGESFKSRFPRANEGEREAILLAVRGWPELEMATGLLPSLANARDEFQRLSP